MSARSFATFVTFCSVALFRLVQVSGNLRPNPLFTPELSHHLHREVEECDHLKGCGRLRPFARFPNSIVAINAGDGGKPSSGTALGNIPAMLGIKDYPILILRDYSSNVRRMLQVLEKMEEQ